MRMRLACLAAILLYAGSASATPVTYFFSSGSAKVTATAGLTQIVDTTVALDGLFVQFDSAVPSVINFSFTAPQSAPIAMLAPYGGFDTFVIESASINPGVGFTNNFIAPAGPGMWNFLIGPVDVAGVYSASSSTGPPPVPVSNLPVPFTGSSFLNGSINTSTMVFELFGITLTQLDGALFGEANNLVVKADITWTGMVVPEPGTATLLATGLVGMALRRKTFAMQNRQG